jgi:glycine/D-amino acid oxidase-like deaminating enzyme
MKVKPVKAFQPAKARADAPRVAIIGAGVCGLSTAVHLVNLGVTDVVVVDAHHPASGTSGRSVGMVETQVASELDISPRVYGRRFVESLHAEHGLEWVRQGYLRLAHGRADIDAFERSANYQSSLGVTDARVLSSSEIEERWPGLVADDRAGGLFGAGDGYVDGHEFCDLMVRLVRSQGVKVRPSVRVLGATTDADAGWTLETTAGNIDADVVVNAAGPWAAVVGDLLGAAVPLESQQHGAAVINAGDGYAMTMPFVMDLSDNSPEEGLYFRPEGATLIAGIHAERPGQNVRPPDAALGRLDAAEIGQIVELLVRRVRGLESAALAGSWSGMYPVSPDLVPLVGRHPHQPNVVCALGAGGSGIQLSPAMGLIAAASIVGEDVGFSDVRSHWEPSRFS